MRHYQWVWIVLGVLTSTPAWSASGNALPRAPASALGMADANVALAQGASAQFINPANLSAGGGTKTAWEAGGFIARVSTGLRRHSATTATAAGDYSAKDVVAISPYAAIASAWSDKVAVGFSLDVPYGISSEWPDRTFDVGLGPLGTADIAQKAELTALRLGPALSVKLDDRLAVGGRVFAQHVKASEESDISKIEGDGNSFGAQVGVRYALDNVIFGAAYTTRTRTELKGTLSNVHPVAAGTLVPGDAHVDILLPARLQLGAAFRVRPELWWEWDLDWMEWGYVDELTIRQSNGTIANAGRNTRNNRNTLSVYTGVKWAYSPRLTLYSGLGYDPSPVVEEDVVPTSSVTRKTRIAIGASRELAQGNRLEVAYQFVRGHSRRINESNQDSFGPSDTNLYEGTYDTRSHIIGLSYVADF